jgi:hypothetical protein
MADTANVEPEDLMISEVTHTLREIIEELKRMTPEEFRQSLVHAGIIDEHGKLTPMYKRRK